VGGIGLSWLPDQRGVYDVVVAGGGIVGLSTAYSLLRRWPGLEVALLEKESGLALHQTGHNSGVLHSGIYYPPGSLKARFAIAGRERLASFCAERGFAHERCGKVLLATSEAELPALERLYERGLEHELELRWLCPRELLEHEPHARGEAAVFVPETGIVDYREVSLMLAAEVEAVGGTLWTGRKVVGVEASGEGMVVQTPSGGVQAKVLVNCAGPYSDRLAAMCGVRVGMKVLPFRGEHYGLRPERRYLVRNLIYPVPDPEFPFLGVHLTRTVEGEIEAGPNAVLGLAREGYGKTEVNLGELSEILGPGAFWRLAGRYWRTGLAETLRSLSRRGFARSLKRLVPEVEERDLVPMQAGVRAQALSEDGKLVDDFAIFDGESSVHICNALSPAATACP
jgi:(S)-2-hydroxyglutarate dehydrogenase